MKKVVTLKKNRPIGRLISLVVIFGMFFVFGYAKDITVIEQSDNDNGYLTQKAEGNPDAHRATSVEDMVDKVLDDLGEGETIGTLTLVGHGSPGNISVGDGQGSEDGKRINGNCEDWEPHLEKLKGKFGPGGKVVLVGCNVGSCDKGRNKLKKIADVLGVPVEAPTGKTYGDCSEEPGSEHQVAEPGEDPPEHKDSPSDTKKKKEAPASEIPVNTQVDSTQQTATRDQAVPLINPDSVLGIAVYPIEFQGDYNMGNIVWDIVNRDEINDFFANIDFTTPINGLAVGANYNARVFLNINGRIAEYRIFCDFDYFMTEGDWENMYDIAWPLKQKLRVIVDSKLANPGSDG